MWIETIDKLPKVCETVLICTKTLLVCTGHLSKRNQELWVLDTKQEFNEMVLAWQRLPDPLIYSQSVSSQRFLSYQELMFLKELAMEDLWNSDKAKELNEMLEKRNIYKNRNLY